MMTVFNPGCDMSAQRFLLNLKGVTVRLAAKRKIIGAGFLALMALAVLGGCSTLQLGYRQAPALAHWWLDSYVDFDELQSQRVKQSLSEWHGWHRQTQLAAYAEHLALARRWSAGEVTADQLCNWNETALSLIEPALERALPAAAGVVLSLSPQQLARIDAKARQRTAKMREEWLPDDPGERMQAAVKRNLKRLDDFFGSSTDEQRQLVEEALRLMPVDTATWMEQRDRRHREMMATLTELARDKPAQAVAQQRLRQVIDRFNGRSPIGGKAQAAASSRATCEWMARVHNVSTPAQRQHLARKLRTWEDDLRALLPAPASAAAPGASLAMAR